MLVTCVKTLSFSTATSKKVVEKNVYALVTCVKTLSFPTATSKKVVEKNVYAPIPKGNMGCNQYTVRNDRSCRSYFCCFPLALANICPWPPVQFTQNHPLNLSGLSRVLFPTTFLEIAVCGRCNNFTVGLYVS